MVYGLLADAVLVLHAAFIAFVVLGGALVLWRPRLIWLHLPVLAWGATIEFAGFICPLTPLENWLRVRGGGAGYSGGFIEQYLWPLIYPAALTREIQIVLGIALLAFNALVYFFVWRARSVGAASSRD
ncbi:MAG: DUF2784 domain-containing protein [Pseudomonadota bacterium]